MIASAADVIKAVEEYILAAMRDRARPPKRVSIAPFFGNFNLHGEEEVEEEDASEAPKKLEIAMSVLEAYIELRVMRSLKELIEAQQDGHQAQPVPEGYHPLYPG